LKISALVAACALFACACGVGKGAGAAEAASREMFKSRCAVCHGEDGLGRQIGEMRAHSLKSESALAMTEERMVQWVRRGSGDMPSFAASLNDEQIRGLVRHVRKNIQGL
jgi:cytochrome c6